jgi:hypothetical protein
MENGLLKLAPEAPSISSFEIKKVFNNLPVEQYPSTFGTSNSWLQ